MLEKHLGKKNRILHGKAGPRTDGEMCRTLGVADQHRIARAPATVAYVGEIAPDRAIRDQPLACERFGKHALAIAQRVRLAHRGEAGALPGRRVALDDEGAHVRRVPVVMRVEVAVLVRHEGLGQGRKYLRGSKPREFVGKASCFSSKVLSAADERVRAVGGDDEIVACKVFI